MKDDRPTLASAGISKDLAKQARAVAAITAPVSHQGGPTVAGVDSMLEYRQGFKEEERRVAGRSRAWKWVRAHWVSGVLLLIALIAARFWWPYLSSEDGSRGIDSLVKILGGVLAVWWFLRRDRTNARLRVSQQVTADPLDGSISVSHAVHVTLTVENVGEVPFTAKDCSVKIFGVDPLTKDVQAHLRGGVDTVREIERDDLVPYFVLAERTLDFGDFALRPSEAGTLTLTATIQSPVELAYATEQGVTDLAYRSILVRSRLSREGGLAWTASAYLDLPAGRTPPTARASSAGTSSPAPVREVPPPVPPLG